MKSNQIKHGLWKNHVVHFNGVMGTVIDHIEGTNRFLVKFVNSSFKWIDKELIVWS